jgi:1-acyl-sn-glycerol-3-phosphate acyltransferase
LKALRAPVLLGLLAALTLALMPLQQVFLWLRLDLARTFPMHYHRLVCRLLGVRCDVIGRTAADGPLLIVSNHVSWLDILVLSTVAPVSFVAKREVAGWPIFGTLARLQRTVFVDRARRQAVRAATRWCCFRKELRVTAAVFCPSRPRSSPPQDCRGSRFSRFHWPIAAIATCP